MKILITIVSIVALAIVGTYAENEKYDPAKYEKANLAESYEATLKNLYENVTSKDVENLRMCRIFSEKGKEYKELNRGDIFYDETIKNCERRIKLYCGALMAAKSAEDNESK